MKQQKLSLLDCTIIFLYQASFCSKAIKVCVLSVSMTVVQIFVVCSNFQWLNIINLDGRFS